MNRIALFTAVSTMSIGCTFSNTNPFTGETAWTVGDACVDCGYNDVGLPNKGQASGPLSEEGSKAIIEAIQSHEDPVCEESIECPEPEAEPIKVEPEPKIGPEIPAESEHFDVFPELPPK